MRLCRRNSVASSRAWRAETSALVEETAGTSPAAIVVMELNRLRHSHALCASDRRLFGDYVAPLIVAVLRRLSKSKGLDPSSPVRSRESCRSRQSCPLVSLLILIAPPPHLCDINPCRTCVLQNRLSSGWIECIQYSLLSEPEQSINFFCPRQDLWRTYLLYCSAIRRRAMRQSEHVSGRVRRNFALVRPDLKALRFYMQ